MVMGMVRITIDGKEKLYEEGIKYEIIAREYQHLYKEPIALVIINGKIRELMKRVDRDCELTFATYGDAIGHKTYVRSAIMLLMKAIKDVAGYETASATRWNLQSEPDITAGSGKAFLWMKNRSSG